MFNQSSCFPHTQYLLFENGLQIELENEQGYIFLEISYGEDSFQDPIDDHNEICVISGDPIDDHNEPCEEPDIPTGVWLK